jgi:hypothetical protein
MPPFRVVSGGGSYLLAPRQTRDVTVEFAPPGSDSFGSSMLITSTDPRASRVQVALLSKRR